MNKRFLLIDADSKIPNLALMKLSTYLKECDHSVDLIKAGISYYPKRRHDVIIDAKDYDEVYVSYIFEGSNNFLKIINNTNIFEGGVGINLKTKLCDEIEQLPPDYSLYPENDTSYGFITRGCIRNCKFCKVPEKEGKLFFVQHPTHIIKHKKVKFLDNNILAYKDHLAILQWLVDNKIKYQFNQGLDIRLINDENAKLLGDSNYFDDHTFAFDNIKDESMINKKLSLFKKYITKDWRIKFFVYCNANMNISDIVYRVNWCKQNKVFPYLMRDINCWDSVNSDFFVDFAGWCNQRGIFKYMDFDEYIQKRQPKNIKRQQKSRNLYYNKG